MRLGFFSLYCKDKRSENTFRKTNNGDMATMLIIIIKKSQVINDTGLYAYHL